MTDQTVASWEWTMSALKSLRIVEMGHAVAGPLAGTLLGDFGAEVIKVERPPIGDTLRNMGPKKNGVGLWWLVSGRNKKSLTLDLKAPEGVDVLRDLLKTADVLVENYRPGVLEKMGLGWDDLHALNPRLIMLRISGFGQTGPYSRRGGFGKVGEAFSGATNLTGRPDEPPIHPSYSLGDTVCSLAGAFGVSMALYSRERTGVGQMIDLALYEPMFRLIEWQLPMHVMAGLDVKRNGPRFPFTEAFVTDVCHTSDGHAVVISAATTESLGRMRDLLIEENVASGDLSTDQLADGVKKWIAGHDRDTVLEKFQERNLVGGSVYTPSEMLEDEHMRARGNIINISHPELGDVPMPGVVPTLSGTPGEVRWTGPAVGEHTDEVLREALGYDAPRIARLRQNGVV